MENEPIVHLGLKVPVNLKQRLEAKAAAEDRPVSSVVRLAIEQYLKPKRVKR